MRTADLVARLRRLGTDLAEVEVKQAAGGLPRDIVETLSAFANGAGGVLVLGLSEAKGFLPAPGFDAKAIRDALATACSEAMEPPLRPLIEIEEFEGALIVRADIAEADPLDKPCHVKSRGAHQGSFIRGGDGDRLLSHYEVTQLLANRTQPKFDLEPVLDATVGDLDAELVTSLLSRAEDRHPRTFKPLTREEALVRLNVLTYADGRLVPTVAGLLGVGAYPQQFFPQLFIAVVVLHGTEFGEPGPDGARFMDNATVDGPIPDMLEGAAAVLRRNMRKAAIIKGLGREDRYDYPLDVIRELLVNAVMHRDYGPGGRGMHIQVEFYADRLMVNSPGGLYGDVSAQLLGTREQRSSSRNAALAKLLSDIPIDARSGHSISENRGSGLPAVMRALRNAGMSPARFDVTPGHMAVTVPGHALLGVDVVEWIGSLGQDGLSDEQNLALAMMLVTGRVTNGMLQAWGVDRLTAGNALRDLVDRNLSFVSGGKRYASYRLAAEPEQMRRDVRGQGTVTGRRPDDGDGVAVELDAIVQAIRAGHGTARAIESALGMNYQAILRRIRILIDRGVIERTHARNDRRQSYRLIGQGDRRDRIQ